MEIWWLTGEKVMASCWQQWQLWQWRGSWSSKAARVLWRVCVIFWCVKRPYTILLQSIFQWSNLKLSRLGPIQLSTIEYDSFVCNIYHIYNPSRHSMYQFYMPTLVYLATLTKNIQKFQLKGGIMACWAKLSPQLKVICSHGWKEDWEKKKKQKEEITELPQKWFVHDMVAREWAKA